MNANLAYVSARLLNEVPYCLQFYSALVTDLSHDKNHLVCHNDFYEQILLPKDLELMGKTVQVEIVGATKFSMVGKVISGSVLRPTAFEPLKAGEVSGAGIVAQKPIAEQQTDAGTSTFQIIKWSLLFCLIAYVLSILERSL